MLDFFRPQKTYSVNKECQHIQTSSFVYQHHTLNTAWSCQTWISEAPCSEVITLAFAVTSPWLTGNPAQPCSHTQSSVTHLVSETHWLHFLLGCWANGTYFGILILAFREWFGRWRRRFTLYTCACCVRRMETTLNVLLSLAVLVVSMGGDSRVDVYPAIIWVCRCLEEWWVSKKVKSLEITYQKYQ